MNDVARFARRWNILDQVEGFGRQVVGDRGVVDLAGIYGNRRYHVSVLVDLRDQQILVGISRTIDPIGARKLSIERVEAPVFLVDHNEMIYLIQRAACEKLPSLQRLDSPRDPAPRRTGMHAVRILR